MSEAAQTVVRAFDILYCFSEEEPVLSVAEVAQRVGLNRTTTHRLLHTLERCHAVQRNAATGRFSLHPRLLQLSSVIFKASDLRTVAQVPMTTLSERTGETVALHVRDGWFRIVFMQIESRHDLKVTYPRIGEPISLNLGAPSKAILASLSTDELEAFLENEPLVGTTEASITDVSALRSEVERVRAQGYAVSFEERRRGVASIAAPVFDASGEVVAAVNVIGPTIRIEDGDVPALATAVQETGREISRRLGSLDETRQAVDKG